MELKQKQCFTPNIIQYFGLEALAGVTRETTEFVNLYSRFRGQNRFKALLKTFDLLERRSEFVASGLALPDRNALRDWVSRAVALDNASLEEEAVCSADPSLWRVIEWSVAVNREIEARSEEVFPFSGANDCLKEACAQADLVVVSQTPTEALEREWQAHGMAHLPQLICGQELGTKADHLRGTAGERYAPGRVLMVGDAAGDRAAAAETGALFFPILPGRETQSWEEFRSEGLPRFFEGQFAGEYETKLLDRFDACLPETPPWEVAGK
jgi:phosphoglycolate phosphatase-like HAD superfamily hydrolase